MLIHPTVERLRLLGLTAMAETLIELQNHPQAAEMPHADWLGLLIDREATFRDNRRLSRRLAAAKLRQAATVENVDYRTARGLDRALFQALTTSQWVREHNHLAIIGRPELENLGSLVRSATRLAAMVFPSSTSGRRGCSQTLRQLAVRDACRA